MNASVRGYMEVKGIPELRNIPIGLCNAVSEKSISLTTTCPVCNDSVTQTYYCAQCEQYHLPSETAKAFKAGGEMLPVSKEELAALPKANDKTIRFTGVMAADTISGAMMDRYYQIEADGPGAEAFGTFVTALGKRGFVAVGTCVISQRLRGCLLVPERDGEGNLGAYLVLLHNSAADPIPLARVGGRADILSMTSQLSDLVVDELPEVSDPYTTALAGLVEEKLMAPLKGVRKVTA